jgi:hypothetical protein
VDGAEVCGRHIKMAVKQENLEVDSAAGRSRPVALITENGFSVVRANETEVGGSFSFLVTDPEGSELEVKVEIAASAMSSIRLRSRGRITRESSYWICCAERRLAEYLWENESFPPERKLSVEQLNADDLCLAIRW